MTAVPDLEPASRPPRLRAGDRVEIVAPSGPVDPQRLRRGRAALESLGLRVTVGNRTRDATGYLAGSDVDRAADLERAWLDEEVRAVVCARGGYGAVRLVDLLGWSAMASAPVKVFLGGSDATALHLAIGARLGATTLFGPMPATGVLGADPPDATTLAHLSATLLASDDPSAVVYSGRTLCPGRAGGVTTGGTLSLLAAAAGTPDFRAASGGLAFLEDVDESAYRVDRMLTQLLRAGWFAGVTGIVLGSWEACPGAEAVLAERLAPLGVPILAGLPVGHGTPQLTLPLGAAATLDATAGTLTLDRPALA